MHVQAVICEGTPWPADAACGVESSHGLQAASRPAARSPSPSLLLCSQLHAGYVLKSKQCPACPTNQSTDRCTGYKAAGTSCECTGCKAGGWRLDKGACQPCPTIPNCETGAFRADCTCSKCNQYFASNDGGQSCKVGALGGSWVSIPGVVAGSSSAGQHKTVAAVGHRAQCSVAAVQHLRDGHSTPGNRSCPKQPSQKQRCATDVSTIVATFCRCN